MSTFLTRHLGPVVRPLSQKVRALVLRPLAGWGVLLLALLVYWVQLYYSHQAQLQQVQLQTRQGASQTVHALALQTEALIRKIDYVAVHLGEHWNSQNRSEFLDSLQVAQQTFMPGALTQVSVADARGHIVFSSLSPDKPLQSADGQPVSIADREHFTAHLDEQDELPHLFISHPVQGRVSQQWIVQFSRPLHDARGQFSGVIVLSVPARYLSRALQDIFPDPADVALLLRADGAYLARSQGMEGVMGQSVPRIRQFLTDRSATHGVYETVAPPDGIERYYAWHRVTSYPIVVSLGISKQRALASVQQALHDSHVQNVVGSSLLLLAAAWITHLWLQRSRQAQMLATTSERLELALRGGNLGTWDWNCKTQENHFNELWAARLGYQASELAPHFSTWQERIHPDDWPRVQAACMAHLQGQSAQYESEYRMRHRDDHWIWVLDRGQVVEWASDGSPQRMAGTVLDISDRKIAEAAAQGLRERLSKLMREVPGAVYQYLQRPDGTACLPYASPGIQGIYGITPEEAALSADKIFAHLHPADRPRVIESIQASAADLVTWRCEHRVRLSDGTVRWVLGQANPERTADGGTLWHGYIHDITAEHAAAEALRLHAEYQRLALQAVRDGLWSWDIAHGSLEWDEYIREMLGEPHLPATLRYQDWLDRLHPTDRERILPQWHAQMRQHPDQVIAAEYRMRTAQGQWLWVEARGRIVAWGEDGLPARMVGTYTDISTRVAQAQLHHALIDQSRAAILLVDQQRQILYANARLVEIFATPGEDITQRPMSSLHISPEHFDGMRVYYDALQHGGKVRFEYPMRDAQGKIRWFDMHAVLRDPDEPDSDVVWTLVDITEKHQSAAALAMERLRLTTLLECFPGGVLMEDAQGVVTMANQNLCDWLELPDPAAALQGVAHEALCERLGPARAAWLSVPGSATDGEKRRNIEVLSTTGRTLEINWVPIARDGEQLGRFWLLQDISERKQREMALATLAATDVLTSLPNRRSFMASLESAVLEACSHPERGYALMMMDIDHFKRVNDTYGHPVGDAVLQHVAQLIRHNLRQNDTAGRLGGEEFAVLLQNIQPSDALALANRVREMLSQTPALTAAGKVTVTISIGMVLLRGEDATRSLSHADEALYMAKNSGRNCVCVWTP
ncbi:MULTISPECIES: PAS domain-containing protein [Giesbergeria]|uniref:PAS domain-containing protein n=1 Tax=Giesbergeria sinuosa TaxID=80883 RepID=A0ABV9QBW3_9BURK